jgi:hypothetical protein
MRCRRPRRSMGRAGEPERLLPTCAQLLDAIVAPSRRWSDLRAAEREHVPSWRRGLEKRLLAWRSQQEHWMAEAAAELGPAVLPCRRGLHLFGRLACAGLVGVLIRMAV